MAEVKLTKDPIAEELRSKYPSNSIIQKPPKEEKPKLDSVVTNTVSKQKKTIFQSIKQAIIPGDIKDIKSHVINQVILPNLRYGIVAAVELIVTGQMSRRWPTYGGTQTNRNNRTDYNYISSGTTMSRNSVPQQIRDTHDFQNLRFESYDDVENVISTMLDIIDRDGVLSVAQFYQLCGVEPDFQDEQWGWKSFRKLEAKRIGDGYVIDMQPPKKL